MLKYLFVCLFSPTGGKSVGLNHCSTHAPSAVSLAYSKHLGDLYWLPFFFIVATLMGVR